MLNTNEFLKRLDNILNSNNIQYTNKMVSYNRGNSENRLKSLEENIINIVFNKETEFAYQQEFRGFVENSDVEDHLMLLKMELSDITMIIPTKDLINLKINLNFKIKKMIVK